MPLRYRSLLLIIALALAGCGTEAAVAPPTAPPAPTEAPASAEPPTRAPAALPTAPPEPTLPPPTAAPTSLPEPTPPPTALPTAPPEPTAPPTAIPTAAPTRPSGPMGDEIAFLRGRALWALDLQSRGERKIADDVTDFVPAPGGEIIALVRGAGRQSEIWLVGRDGRGLRQATQNSRAETSVAWSPDRAALVYASADTDEPLASDWGSLPRWCAASEVRTLDLASGAEGVLAPGCEPAISPDGRRIAFTAPPSAAAPGAPDKLPQVANSIRLINRRGENGWNFAKADGQSPIGNGMFVYGPSWSPDGTQVIYHRFMGMQVEVDINLSEVGKSFEGKGVPIAEGAGVLAPARYAPGGRMVAIVRHDAGNARGLVGYGEWSTQLIQLDGTRSIFLPEGQMEVLGQDLGVIYGAQSVVWSPDGGRVALQLPIGWRPDGDPESWGEGPGMIGRLTPGSGAVEPLVTGVDYGSPLAWLPSR